MDHPWHPGRGNPEREREGGENKKEKEKRRKEKEGGQEGEGGKGKGGDMRRLGLSRGGTHAATGPGIISVVHSEGSTAFGANNDRE